MAKKSKGRDKSGKKASADSSSGSPDIFKTLFGDVVAEQSSVSIFSNDNPFRRRPIDPSQQPQPPQKQQVEVEHGSVEDAGTIMNGDSENPNLLEVKKRKRNKEKKPSSDSGSIDEIPETQLDIKKSKKIEAKSSILGAESGKGGEGNDMEEREGTIAMEGKKKKRKRDQLEAEYESKRYGVVETSADDGEGREGKGNKVGEKRKKVDDPVDMVPSKEGFDDEAKLLRTVFVGNLPLKVKKKALLKEFSQFGEVESVRIRSVPLLDTKKPRKGAIMQKKINDAVDCVNAYIVYKSEEAAQASLAHNMAVVGEKHIRVDRACPPRKKLKADAAPLFDNKRTVFVGNLPFDVKDEEVYQVFSGIKDLEPSTIEGIRVVRDPGSSLGKGIAYILFKTRGAANLVVKKHRLMIRDRELRLSHAKSDLTPSKRENQWPERNSSPSKKLATGSANRDSSFKVDPSSYQGLRASKSGSQKKPQRKVMDPVRFNSGNNQKGNAPKKERTVKRPKVAERKAKALMEKALKGGGGGHTPDHAGSKRKMESRTPEQARPNKKFKKFR